jgi:hypothetical protein
VYGCQAAFNAAVPMHETCAPMWTSWVRAMVQGRECRVAVCAVVDAGALADPGSGKVLRQPYALHLLGVCPMPGETPLFLRPTLLGVGVPVIYHCKAYAGPCGGLISARGTGACVHVSVTGGYAPCARQTRHQRCLRKSCLIGAARAPRVPNCKDRCYRCVATPCFHACSACESYRRSFVMCGEHGHQWPSFLPNGDGDSLRMGFRPRTPVVSQVLRKRTLYPSVVCARLECSFG